MGNKFTQKASLKLLIPGLAAVFAYISVNPVIHFLAPKKMEVMSRSLSEDIMIRFIFVTLFVCLAGLIMFCSTLLSRNRKMSKMNSMILLNVAALAGLTGYLFVHKSSIDFFGDSVTSENTVFALRALNIERIPLMGIIMVAVTFVFVGCLPKKKS